MGGRDIIQLLNKHGWVIDRVSGSHHIMVKDGERAIPIPVHGNRDLPKGLIPAILKQAKLK